MLRGFCLIDHWLRRQTRNLIVISNLSGLDPSGESVYSSDMSLKRANALYCQAKCTTIPKCNNETHYDQKKDKIHLYRNLKQKKCNKSNKSEKCCTPSVQKPITMLFAHHVWLKNQYTTADSTE